MMIATLAAALAAAAPAPALCTGSAAQNRRIVTDFYTRALVEKQVRAGFEEYVRADFVEHKPDIKGGTRDGAVAFLEGLVKQLPGASWKIHRAVADGDLVALHASFVPAPGAPAYVIADFFRVEKCKIVEHWDVVGPPSKESGNPHPRF